MRIAFMSLSDYRTISFNGLYTNLLRVFIEHGDEVYILSPYEKRVDYDGPEIITEGKSTIIKFKTGNIQKTNIIEKGINTLLVDKIFISAIKRHLKNIHFDVILYPTPPITLLGAIKYLKERDKAKCYLLLKDIFPQNAVDIGIMSKNGIKGIVYRYFRDKERKLYRVSDYIGCMSEGNVKYLLEHNQELDSDKVEICPNTTEPIDMSIDEQSRVNLREKYGIPLDKTVFVYGGNLGKPQGIPFIIECLKSQMENKSVFFVVIGSGTEYHKIEKFIEDKKPENIKLIRRLPKEDYDRMVGSCDVGLIFLDHRFTIPNFPSRMLAYTLAKIPIIASTDPYTDIGKTIVNGGFGWCCESNSVEAFDFLINEAINAERVKMGIKGYEYTCEHYSNELGYQIIKRHFEG